MVVVVMIRVLVGALLLAHGLVHLLYLAPDVPEFSLDRSWLVPGGALRRVGAGLVVATIAAFAVLTLAVWGVPGLSSLWPALAVVAALLSAVLLTLFWMPQLLLGLALDLGLLVLAASRPAFVERLVP